MAKQRLFVLGVILSIFLIGMASASTLITGKIYNADFSDVITDASVTVYCQEIGSNEIYIMDTNSGNGTFMDDGSYAIVVDEGCSEGATVRVTASKGTLSGEGTGTVYTCEGENCASQLMAIVNPSLKAPAPQEEDNNNGGGGGGGGGSRRYYNCGNGICDSGETASTCPTDCASVENLSLEENNETEVEEIPENKPGITGAVIGALGNTGNLIIFIVAIAGIIVFGIVRFIRKRKKISKN